MFVERSFLPIELRWCLSRLSKALQALAAVSTNMFGSCTIENHRIDAFFERYRMDGNTQNSREMRVLLNRSKHRLLVCGRF
jgi:DNA-binding transcriptional regulator YbjK